MRGVTIILLLLPVGIGLWALISHDPGAGRIALLLMALYGVTWFCCRPSGFIVSHDELEIVFPAWQRRIPIRTISRVRLISKETFHREFGQALRIGVGGLWGGFGWLWTSQRGLIEFYISRSDPLVCIDRSTGNSLLITPDQANQFVETVQSRLH
jgi:hypothetical protein